MRAREPYSIRREVSEIVVLDGDRISRSPPAEDLA